jgi:hypothetical protein
MRFDEPIRVLSVRQPWAWLIVNGYKTTLNETGHTDYRGTFLIHAAKRAQSKGARAFVERTIGIVPPPDLPRNGIVGVATLIDCVDTHSSEWLVGPVDWIFRDARPLPFIAMSASKIIISEANPELLEQVRRACGL